MNQVLQSIIASFLLTTAGAFLGRYFDAATTNLILVSVAGAAAAIIVAVWRAAQRSPNAIIAAAANAIAPTGGVIQTTPEIASAIPNPNVVTKPAP